MGGRSGSTNVPWGIDKVPEFKEKQFKESYGNFYGMDNREVSKLDYNKLYQASRADGGKQDGGSNLKPELKEDAAFKRNKKVFFEGKYSDTESVYNANTAKFFAANDQNKPDVGDKFAALQNQMDPKKEEFKKSAAAFAGEAYCPPKVNPSPTKPEVNTKSGTFKNDAKKFYAVEKAETESQGS